MLTTVLTIAKITIALSMGLCLIRILRGPHLSDRALALDSIAVHAVAYFMLISIELKSRIYLDAAMIITLVGFLATIALGKFILKGKIFE